MIGRRGSDCGRVVVARRILAQRAQPHTICTPIRVTIPRCRRRRFHIRIVGGHRQKVHFVRRGGGRRKRRVRMRMRMRIRRVEIAFDAVPVLDIGRSECGVKRLNLAVAVRNGLADAHSAAGGSSIGQSVCRLGG